ncbi:hypothetical protein [Rhizobium sp. BK399]|uniref:hypothetical protein n=1 Tax=Rhizobium sp. BK399 TaxID=2587063 RepID=UPI0018517F3B|nr:hypothetical protein [Rhizobium sp. BK399]MBB3545477.1 hypothetical protein [Rhizobium sp. BK399]
MIVAAKGGPRQIQQNGHRTEEARIEVSLNGIRAFRDNEGCRRFAVGSEAAIDICVPAVLGLNCRKRFSRYALAIDGAQSIEFDRMS